MDHVAIMKASWGMTEKIAQGEKTIESRWLKYKTTPWKKVTAGDRIFFKDSGKPVSIVAHVDHVEYLESPDEKVIIKKHGRELCLTEAPAGKPFVVLIFLKNPERTEPFHINKKGFGAMAAWISIKNIEDIRI